MTARRQHPHDGSPRSLGATHALRILAGDVPVVPSRTRPPMGLVPLRAPAVKPRAPEVRLRFLDALWIQIAGTR